jgi:hypothetical protein
MDSKTSKAPHPYCLRSNSSTAFIQWPCERLRPFRASGFFVLWQRHASSTTLRLAYNVNIPLTYHKTSVRLSLTCSFIFSSKSPLELSWPRSCEYRQNKGTMEVFLRVLYVLSDDAMRHIQSSYRYGYKYQSHLQSRSSNHYQLLSPEQQFFAPQPTSHLSANSTE